MASRDLTYAIGVDASDATAGLRKLEGAVRSTMRTVEEELEDGATAGDKLATSLDKVAAQAKEDLNSAAIAAQELKGALERAGSGLDVGDALSSLKRMGLSFDEITQEADKLAVSLKGLDDVRAEGVRDLDSIAPGLATKLDDVSKSADSSKSALANMIGNSTQTLGESVGIVGDLGVGIGQLGEYFADAAFEGEGLASVFKNMGAVAGPMVALAVATKAVTDVMGRFTSSQDRTTESVEMWEDALDSGGDATEAYADNLRDLGKVVLDITRSQSTLSNVVAELDSNWYSTGIGVSIFRKLLGASTDETRDLTKVLGQAGLNVDRWTAAIEGGAPALEQMATFLARTNLSAKDQEDILTALGQAQEDHAKAAQNDAVATAFFGDAAEEAGPSAEELARAQEEAAQAARDHAIAVTAAARELDAIGSTFEEMARRGSALASVFDMGNAPLDMASASRDIAVAIGELGEAAKGIDLSKVLDPSNVQADALLDKLDGLRPEIQAKVQEAFAAGGPEAAQQTADWYVQSIVNALGGKLTAEEVADLLNLGDLTAEIQIATKLADVERVKRQLEVLTGVAGESPLTASIALALDAGTITPEAAELLVQAQLGQAGVKIPSSLDTPDTKAAQIEAAAFVMDLPTALDTTGAASDAAGFRKAVETGHPVEAPLDADPTDAEREAEAFRRKTETTEPVVPVQSDTARALATMRLLMFAAALLSPEVTVTANTAPALLALGAVAAQRPRVPVEAYLADYPTASEIQARIGRPRIPVDIVVGSSIRITGVRD